MHPPPVCTSHFYAHMECMHMYSVFVYPSAMTLLLKKKLTISLSVSQEEHMANLSVQLLCVELLCQRTFLKIVSWPRLSIGCVCGGKLCSLAEAYMKVSFPLFMSFPYFESFFVQVEHRCYTSSHGEFLLSGHRA